MATLYRSTKIHGFFNRLIPTSSSMSPHYQHQLSHHSLRIIAPRSISNHIASPYRVSSHLLHYLTSRHCISLSHLFATSASRAPSSTSGLRLHYPRHRLGILRLSHLRTRLASAPVCRSYLAIIYIHLDPTSLHLSFWSTFFYLRYQCIVSGMSLTPHRIYVNKPIIVLSSISSSAWSRGSSS